MKSLSVTSKDPEQASPFNPWVIVMVVLFVCGLWAFSGYMLSFWLPHLPDRGQFGDAFGAINALFSGLALAGVVIALLMQRAELRLQREELRLNRTEQSRLVTAQNESAGALNKQFHIQTLAAEIAILQGLIHSASAELDRANHSIASARQSGSGVGKIEAFAPGAGTRLDKARDELELRLIEVKTLS